MTPDELLRIVATPTRLGKWLAPKIWGDNAQYDVDPWLALTEQIVMDAVLDRDNQAFRRIHVPPQVGKTTFSGLLLPFWVLGMLPETRIIFITYSDDYSRVRGGDVRDLVREFGQDLFGISVDPDREAQGDWRLKGHRGGMLSVGIGSQIAGRSGDLIILDDLLKNAQEAASVLAKALHVREYDSTVRTRLQPGGTMIMTSTRWADDDLAGVIEDRTEEPGYDGDVWQALAFPAIAEPADQEEVKNEKKWRDAIGRKLGEPLTCRFTDPNVAWERSAFYQIRRSTSPFAFSCTFQQNPIATEGGMFPVECWKHYRKKELPEMSAKVRIWEPAATEGGGDWSVGMLMGRGSDGNYYVLDTWRGRLSSDKVLATAKMLAKHDGFDVEVGVEQEKAGAGKSVLIFWEKEFAKDGYRVFPCMPSGSKEVRAQPASTLQQAGHVFIPHEEDRVEWGPVLVDQARRMMGDGRRGTHDDMVDALAYGVMKLLDAGQSYFWDPSTVNPEAERQLEDVVFRHLLGLQS